MVKSMPQQHCPVRHRNHKSLPNVESALSSQHLRETGKPILNTTEEE